MPVSRHPNRWSRKQAGTLTRPRTGFQIGWGCPDTEILGRPEDEESVVDWMREAGLPVRRHTLD